MIPPKESELHLTGKMKNTIWVFTIGLLLLSCTSNTIYDKPKDLIPRDSMVLLLKDMYIATAAKNVKNKNLKWKFSYAELVYQKYKIDSVRFQRSNFYYTSKIDLLQPMLDEVMDSLEADREKFKNLKKVRDSVRKDSLRKIRRANKRKIDTFQRVDKIEKGKIRKTVDQ